MYNEKGKMAFLESIKDKTSMGTIKYYMNTFDMVEPYERKAEKDIIYFTKDELMEICRDLNGQRSPETVKAIFSRLRQYAINTVEYSCLYEFSAEVIRQAIEDNSSRILVTYADIQNWLDKLINPLDKFVLYGLFCGIKGRNFCELVTSSMEDSDEKNRTIWLAGVDSKGNFQLKSRCIKVDEQLFSYARTAADAKWYIQEDKNGVRKKVPLKIGDQAIFKNPINVKDPSKPASFCCSRARQKFDGIYQKAGIPSTVGRVDIFRSGLIYNLRTCALREGIEINQLYDFLKISALPEIEETYNVKINKRFLKEKVGKLM